MEKGRVELIEIVEIGTEAAGLDLSGVFGEQGADAADAGSRQAFLYRVPAGLQ